MTRNQQFKRNAMLMPDSLLCDLLACAGRAEAEVATAATEAERGNAEARLKEVLAEMAATPSETLIGIAAKAARLCFSLYDGRSPGENFGDSLLLADVPLAASLDADIARLLPQFRAAAYSERMPSTKTTEVPA